MGSVDFQDINQDVSIAPTGRQAVARLMTHQFLVTETSHREVLRTGCSVEDASCSVSERNAQATCLCEANAESPR